MQDVYKNIEEYNLGKKHKLLLVFEDMIADMINNNLFGKHWCPGRSEDVPIQRPYEFDSGCPQDSLMTSRGGPSKHSNLHIPKVLSTFLS